MWTAVVIDADNGGMTYIKRFLMEQAKKTQNVVGENPDSRLLLLTDQVYPRLLFTFGGEDAFREPMEIDAEQFISVKGFKAKGKRVATWTVDKVEELEPTRFPEPEEETPEEPDTADGTETATEQEENTAATSVTFRVDEDGQMSLF